MSHKNRKTSRSLTFTLSFALACGMLLSMQLAAGRLTRAHAASNTRAQSQAAASQWTRSGPHEGTVTALAVSQSAPATAYAHLRAPGKYYDTNLTGVFKTTDAGAHWARINYPPTQFKLIDSLAVDPTDSNVVYAGTIRNGVYKSTDGGTTWAGPFGPQEREVLNITIDPVNTSVLYAQFAGIGLYKSTDGGATWTFSGSGIQVIISNTISIDPSNHNVVYAVGGDAGPGQFGGVYKSTDAGANWTRKNAGLPYTSVTDIAIDPSNTSTLYIGTSVGVFKSVDGSANWSASSNGLPQGARFFSVELNPANPSTLYTGGYDTGGVYRSNDSGATWTLAGADTTRVYTLAVAFDGSAYAGSFGAGMFRSTGGGPFAEANDGLPFAPVRNLVADPNNPALVYAGTGADVFRSEDRGDSWAVTSLPQIERPVIGLAAEPSGPRTIYAALDYTGVFKTTDGGLNWTQQFAANSNVNAFAVSPSAPHSAYISTNGSRIYKSNASGVFNQISSPGFVTNLTVDPTNPSVVYAANFNSYFSRSTNGGASWGDLSSYDPNTVTSINGIVVDPSNPSTVYFNSSGSAAPVRKSTDGGVTWNNAAAGLPATGASGTYNVSALTIDPINTSVLYAACYGATADGGGVYKSTDGGASWNPFGAPLANVNALTLDLSGKTIYAGADDGVYKAATDHVAVSFSSDLFAANESAGTATVTVTRASGAGALTVNYSTADGTATAGSDYQSASGSLAFADGETTKTFNVTVLDDSVDEFDEAAHLTLTSADGSATVLSRASLVISDDDQQPSLTVSDVSAPEGDSNTTNFVFHITLSAPSAKPVRVSNVNNTPGTANSGGALDVYAYGGPYTIDFAPGETDKTVTMLVIGDLNVEPDEDFFVNVSGVINATPTDPQGRGVIVNDDATPTASLQINDVSVVEGNSGTTDAVLTVSLSEPTSKTVMVDYISNGGEGTDLQSFGGTLTFAPGETSKTITVHVIGDTTFEPDEQYSVRLLNPRNALMPDAFGVITIINDDPAPTVSVNDITVTEGDSGQKDVSFTVSLSTATQTNVSFFYGLVPGTATRNEDYLDVFGATSFAPGVTTRTITVPIRGDTIPEQSETFSLKLTNLDGATFADDEGVCTILDNDTSGGVNAFQFSAIEYKAQESAGETTITVTRAGDLSAPASVDYATHGSNNSRSASDRSDYTAAAGTLYFAAGESAKTFKVLITDDAFAERDPQFGDEFIDLSLSNPSTGVALGEPKDAFITIIDNETVTSSQNPVDSSQFFVRQHYHDFLNREPDTAGLDFWTHEIEQCGQDSQCREVKRINVSAAFFLSIEFQETGYLVYKVYKAAYGDTTSPNVAGTVPVIRLNEFLVDTQRIGQGVQVGVGDWQAQLEANKAAYFQELVSRKRFSNGVPTSLTPAQFVDALFQNAGVTPTSAQRQAAIDEFGGAANTADQAARARALRRVAENPTLHQNELNRAFVLMEYFGYLRRNPDDAPEPTLNFAGWKFWLTKLNQFNGNFVAAEMVKAFISSDEYRHRFGQ